jgi:uncharacterized protein (DUF302 family)
MSSLAAKVEVKGDLENIILKATEAFKAEGFGALTRINFHEKMKEKLDKDIPPAVVLGMCHPGLAFEVYSKTTDFLSLLPCNLVVREKAKGLYSVEMIKPSAMVGPLQDAELSRQMSAMDGKIEGLLRKIAE